MLKSNLPFSVGLHSAVEVYPNNPEKHYLLRLPQRELGKYLEVKSEAPVYANGVRFNSGEEVFVARVGCKYWTAQYQKPI
jgi:hypothetical protein